MSTNPTRSTRRKAAVLGAGLAGLAVVGAAVTGPSAANAASSTPSASSSAPAPAPSGAPSAHGGRTGTPPTPKPHIDGTVQSVSGSTVTVKDPEGFTRTIVLESGATVKKGTTSSSTSAVVKGVFVHAEGTVDGNGTSLDATSVMIGRPTPPAAGPAGGPAAGGPAAGGSVGAKGAPAAPKAGAKGAPAAPSGAPAAPGATPSASPTSGS